MRTVRFNADSVPYVAPPAALNEWQPGQFTGMARTVEPLNGDEGSLVHRSIDQTQANVAVQSG